MGLHPKKMGFKTFKFAEPETVPRDKVAHLLFWYDLGRLFEEESIDEVKTASFDVGPWAVECGVGFDKVIPIE
jgi:hypothetical protein